MYNIMSLQIVAMKQTRINSRLHCLTPFKAILRASFAALLFKEFICLGRISCLNTKSLTSHPLHFLSLKFAYILE